MPCPVDSVNHNYYQVYGGEVHQLGLKDWTLVKLESFLKEFLAVVGKEGHRRSGMVYYIGVIWLPMYIWGSLYLGNGKCLNNTFCLPKRQMCRFVLKLIFKYDFYVSLVIKNKAMLYFYHMYGSVWGLNL
jgi:hypothetical protein